MQPLLVEKDLLHTPLRFQVLDKEILQSAVSIEQRKGTLAITISTTVRSAIHCWFESEPAELLDSEDWKTIL